MNDFFDGFESDICMTFRMWPIHRKAEVEAILLKET